MKRGPPRRWTPAQVEAIRRAYLTEKVLGYRGHKGCVLAVAAKLALTAEEVQYVLLNYAKGWVLH